MRWLVLKVRQGPGAIPLLVAASLLPSLGSCGGILSDDASHNGKGAEGGADTQELERGGSQNQDGVGGGPDSVGGASSGVGGGPDSVGGASSGVGGQAGAVEASGAAGTAAPTNCEGIRVGGAPPDPAYEFTRGTCSSSAMCSDYNNYYLSIPDQGTLAEPGALCGGSASTVVSGWAARVTLDKGEATDRFPGRITIAKELVGHIQDLPRIGVTWSRESASLDYQIVNLRAEGDDFVFDFDWDSTDASGLSAVHLEFTVEFDIACNEAVSAPHTVVSRTQVYGCDWMFSRYWVSSGDVCSECAHICEMAPSPILPAAKEDPLPLSGVVRLHLREVIRIGRSMVLLAEHDGGDRAANYTWQASGGSLTELDSDVIVWDLPDDDPSPSVRVGIVFEDRAGVASFIVEQAA